MTRTTLLLAAGVVALGGSLAGDPEELAAAGVELAAAAQLRELGAIAGLRGPDGRPSELRPLPVEVVQEGGPLWLAPAISAAVARDGRFVEQAPASEEGRSPGAPAMIRAELVGALDTHALRLQLWRRGAATAPPEPTRRRLIPWALVLGVAVASAAGRWRGWVAATTTLAGVLQGLSLLLPWPETLPAPSVGETLAGGPLAAMAVGLARGLSEMGVAVASGLVVGTALLALFDHRRSRRTGTALGAAALARGLLGTVAGVVALEAALRLGLVPWVATGWGGLAVAGAGLVALAAWLGRRGAGG